MAYSKELLAEMAKAQDLFVWEAPAWEAYERGPRWYLIASVVAGLLALYAVFTANYLFAFIVLLIGIIVILAGNEAPNFVLVQVGHNGVVVDGNFYLFDELNDFALIYNPPDVKILYLQPKNVLRPRLRIQLEDQDPVALRTHLKAYIDEDLDLRNEHFSDIFGRLLRL